MEKQKLDFRLLRADEIDCRIAMVKRNGVSLLLYKDARVDQNILDDTVGQLNWKRSHEMIGDRLYCTVSIRGEDGEWVSKQDVGTESYTEKEKGQASDSFKRACFNWGIGRELYTAPFIWISPPACTIKENNNKLSCPDVFSVIKIGYDEERKINELMIARKDGTLVFTMKKDRNSKTQDQEPAVSEPVGDASTANLVQSQHVNTIFRELQRTGVGMKQLLRNYGLNDIHEMTMDQFRSAMDVLTKKPDKPLDPETVPPNDMAEEGLPWNTPVR